MQLTRLRRRCGLALLLVSATLPLAAQSPASAPAAVPAGADSPAPPPVIVSTPPPPVIPAKQLREAEDAYLDGAKAVDKKDLDTAQKSFARAAQLNPNNRDYALALLVTREHRLSEIVQSAAKARLLGQNARAETLLEQARAIDPDNAVVAQHFGTTPAADIISTIQNDPIASSLGGAVALAPKPGRQDLHLRGDPRSVLTSLYAQFGITASFDKTFAGGPSMHVDVDQVDFAQAQRIGAELTHTFAVPVQPHTVLLAADTTENRRELSPQVQETLYMPGLQGNEMQELANLARNVFDLTTVTASPSTDTIVLRSDPETLKILKATYAGMIDGGSDVMLDVNLYEIDRTNTRNIGLQLPSSVGIFSVTAEAEQLVGANQSVLQQAIAAGLIKLSGNSVTDLITEVGFLIASGTVSAAQYSNLLGIFGNGLTLAGLYVGSGSTFNLLLNSSDVRTLDAVQLRSGSGQDATFRAGTRYPIITSTYSTGISSSLASAVSGLNINGTSVGSLLQQYLGSSSVTVPQIQFEDLGLTLKATPHIVHGRSVQLKLDLKIESLGAGSLNNIPILNDRELTSEVTIPAGQTALLASEVSSSETRAVQGIPGLSEIPGFQSSTTSNVEKNTGELLITITPHIVRQGTERVASRPFLLPYNPNASAASSGFVEEYTPPPPPSSAPPIPQNNLPQRQPVLTPQGTLPSSVTNPNPQ